MIRMLETTSIQTLTLEMNLRLQRGMQRKNTKLLRLRETKWKRGISFSILLKNRKKEEDLDCKKRINRVRK
jgi:hypothetical protein